MKTKILALGALLIILGASGVIAINARQSLYKTTQATSDLTGQEIESLVFMREEEKLARDVYLTLYEKWNILMVFSNIAVSEQKHMDSIKQLLDRYGIDDPSEGNGIGEFTDQELQTLYNQLITEGLESLNSGLTVGGKIEELDIIDLKNYIELTNRSEIKRVYTNLMEGSKNHLRAFVKELNKQGVTYEPFYLNQEEFNDIINQGKNSQNRQTGTRHRSRNSTCNNFCKSS